MFLRKLNFWRLFRFIFVVFSLYLLGDAIYRWSGFRYYASFSEFLPNVALISILWSIVAVFTAVIVWLSLKTCEWFFQHIGWKIKMEHLLIFTYLIVLFGALTWWKGRQFIISHFASTSGLRLIVFLCAILLAIFLTWVFRYKAERLIEIIQARITPLVWLFGIVVMLSVPVAGYHLWGKQEDGKILQSTSQSILKDTGDNKRSNIILVLFDAMTARDMSVYGYHRQTTPFISEWAKTAYLFKRPQAGSNFTTPTVASLMTGKRVWTHQLYTPHGRKAFKGDIENLALVLKNHGYYNMALVTNGYASVVRLGIADGFDIAPSPAVFNMPRSFIGIVDKLLYRIFGNKFLLYDWIIKRDFILFRLLNKISSDVYQTVIPPEKVFNRFLAIIEDNPPEPYFAWLHLYPPHSPYLPPEPYMGIFDSSPEMRTLKSQAEAKQFIRKNRLKSPHFPQEAQPIVNLLRARYDEYIKYCDSQLENFISQLRIKNKLKNTVIILSADHGESFSHGYIGHGGPYLYEPMTHIPLIIKEPNQMSGRIIDDLVEQIDIPATILDLAGIPIPSWMEGRSLVPLIRGKKLPPRHVFSMALSANIRGHKITRGTIAVWEGNYKLIYYLDKEKSQLFNLQEDPRELNNLFNKEPEVGQRLLAIIQKSLKKAKAKINMKE